MFQHTAARRRLEQRLTFTVVMTRFQHTAARRRLDTKKCAAFLRDIVSTHSRPKAAGPQKKLIQFHLLFQHTAARRRLVGGKNPTDDTLTCFNTQPPEGGWKEQVFQAVLIAAVSTHSRPKAAGASLKSLAPSGFAALISLSSQEKRECEYNTAFSVTPAFAIS